MSREFPEAAKTKLDAIVDRIKFALTAGPPELVAARSEFMDYDGAIGGQVLESYPEIEYSYDELSTLYGEMFDAAAAAKAPLREVEVNFRKDPTGEWRAAARWISVEEYAKFRESVVPIVEDLRIALRAVAGRVARNWTRVSFDALVERPPSVSVFYGEEERVDSLPDPSLLELVKCVVSTALEHSLVFTGAQWDVVADAEDAPGEIQSAIGVIGADLV